MPNICKSRLSKNLKRMFVRATVESVLVYEEITWSFTSTTEKKLDGDYTRMLRALDRAVQKLYNNIQIITC